MHHDDGAATWRQVIQDPPDRRAYQERAFRIARGERRRNGIGFVTFAVPLPTPLIPPNIHEHAHEPRLLLRQSTGNGFECPSRLEKCLLNEVEGVIGTRGQTPAEAVEPVGVCFEQGGQTVSALFSRGGGAVRIRLCVHILLNVQRPANVGAPRPVRPTTTAVRSSGDAGSLTLPSVPTSGRMDRENRQPVTERA